MSICALWQRLDSPGHDAAMLERAESGWSLRGAAVFRHDLGPACLSYSVTLDSGWRTLRGEVTGALGDTAVRHSIDGGPDGWRLDGTVVTWLSHLWDLDYGFTPATNLLQLRRAGPALGAAVDLPVAWFDLAPARLAELPQRYTRRSPAAYWYEAPSVPYTGLLELAPSGFARSYPRLWRMED